MAPKELTPLVIVEGFLSAHGALAWGRFEEYLNSGSAPRSVLFASVGPVNSLHDRACELYFELVGGTVDYGEAHATEHGHSRYGRRYDRGLYPRWSRQHPLHFLGHSMGGLTIVKLQHLLALDFWNVGTLHPSMILSLNAVSSPFRGTQLVYALGERTDAQPHVRPLSLGSFLAKTIHLVAYLSPLLPAAFDLHVESRNLAYHQTTVRRLFGQLWKSDWAESKDATPFDVTFLAADEREENGEGTPYPETYYRSDTACMTSRSSLSRHNMTHAPRISAAFTLPLILSARAVGKFDFSVLRPTPSFLPVDARRDTSGLTNASERGEMPRSFPLEPLGEEYWANDGVVPLFSQWHPYPCSRTKCHHENATEESGVPSHQKAVSEYTESPRPGEWHVYEFPDAGHISLVPFWLGTALQKHFWNELGLWLRSIDIAQA